MQPLAREFFPKAGDMLSTHHTFVVDYSADTDRFLDMHTDNSDVTFNVCLGKQFTGSGLTFCGLLGEPGHRRNPVQYAHVIGRCVMHLGAQRHGADQIATGRRMNLIIWNENVQFRQSRDFRYMQAMVRDGSYKAEDGAPEPICVSSTWDKDAASHVDRFGVTHVGPSPDAWCPPESI